MTSTAQRIALQNQIWKIANDVRGSVDGWDFKKFVLGTLFYRFISENFTNYIEGGDERVNYANLPDDVITPEIKEDAIKTKGYFIYPSQLFVNVTKNARSNTNLNTDLAKIFAAPNLFYGTSIAVNILVLSKHKTENKTQFIDVSGDGFFKKVTNNNVLLDEHIEKIMSMFDSKEEVVHVATTVDNSKIAENDYNLSVSSYVGQRIIVSK